MAGEIIRPSALPDRPSPVASEKVPVDNGVTVGGATIEKLVLAGRPTASQAEAEAGVDSVKAMTPLTTKQAIQAQGDVRFASHAQGEKADSAVQPEDLATVATTGSYNDLSDKPSSIGVPAGGTTGQGLTKNSNTDYDTKWTTYADVAFSGSYNDLIDKPAVGGASVDVVRATNRLLHGSFIRGAEGWAVSNPSAARIFFSFETDATDALVSYFARAKGQLDATASGQTLLLQSSSIFAVEASKAHVVGFWGSSYGAVNPLPVEIQVKCYDEGAALLGTLTIAKNVSSTRSPTASLYLGQINAQGGSAPAWPVGTVSANVVLSLVSTASQGVHCMSMFAIPADEYPGNPAISSVANFGGGTHEAITVGDYLYVINHGFNWLVKFDANLKYVAHIVVDDYPHDIVAIGGDLWIANQDAASLQRVNIASFTVSNTYAITGARSGFGLATDGTRLWLGAGTNAQGCALYQVNTSTGALTLLSTDLNTGTANIPVQFLDGSVWTIHDGNSQVKRINPTGGATIATINANVGKLYGLGAGGGFIWANGRNGVAKIDPATNTVIARYMYRQLTSGQSNVLVHNGFAIAGCAQGVMAINIATGDAREILLDSGSCKWARNMPSGEIAVGTYAAPWMFVLKA